MKISRCFVAAGVLALCAIISSAETSAFGDEPPRGQFDGNTDIGSPEMAGSASYDAARQEYVLAGSGIDMWGSHDQFHFLWKRMKGDFILRARFQFVTKGVEANRKVGWMIRSSLDVSAPYIDVAEHGDGHACLQYRRSQGTNTQDVLLPITDADVIQLERKGNTYVIAAAHSGEPFVSAQLSDLALLDSVYAGLFVCAHNGKVIEKAVFRDVCIIQPAKAASVP